MLFSPRHAESCSSHVTHHGLGSRSMREEAFTAAIFCACVVFVRARIHPSSLAAQPPPCTRPPNACRMRTRTAQSFFVARKRKQQPQASSVEGYSQRCIECINTPVACFCFSSDTKVHTAANANECLGVHFSFFPPRSGNQFDMPEGSEDDIALNVAASEIIAQSSACQETVTASA
jgi:hypothetical protein